MKMNPVQPDGLPGKRLLSLDFMRGLIMVFLVLESTGLYEHLHEAAGNGPFQSSHYPVLSSSLAWFAFLGPDTARIHVHCRHCPRLFACTSSSRQGFPGGSPL